MFLLQKKIAFLFNVLFASSNYLYLNKMNSFHFITEMKWRIHMRISTERSQNHGWFSIFCQLHQKTFKMGIWSSTNEEGKQDVHTRRESAPHTMPCPYFQRKYRPNFIFLRFSRKKSLESSKPQLFPAISRAMVNENKKWPF